MDNRHNNPRQNQNRRPQRPAERDRAPVNAVPAPLVAHHYTSDESDESDSDSSLGSFFSREESGEDQEWEQDWESDSQEYRRPISSSESERTLLSSSSDSEDDSIVVVDPPVPANSNQQQANIANITNSPVRLMPAGSSRIIHLSDSFDSEESKPKRPRVEPKAEEQPTTSTIVSEESLDDNCTICYEDYTSNGDHRLVSLKCGHFFGKNCIERWIRNEGRGATCPNCKQKTHSRDVRVHFTKTVKMVDNSALEDLKAKKSELEQKNSRLEMELAKTKRELKDWQEKFNGIDNSKRLVPVVNLISRMILMTGAKVNIRTSPNQPANARAFDFNENYFAIGVQLSTGGLFSRYGIRQVDYNLATGQTFNRGAFPLHSLRSRVVAFSPFQPNVILSGGEDKKVITHTIGGPVSSRKSWDMPGNRGNTQVWSACWLTPTTFAVGLADGRIYEFDTLRDDRCHVRDITQGMGHLPIISLTHIPQSNAILACSAKKLMAYRDDASYPLLEPADPIRTITWDIRTLSFVVTYAPSTKPISHKLYRLDIEASAIHCNELDEWKTAYKKSSTLWNNCLFTIESQGLFSVIYNEDEMKLEAHDWSGNRAPAVAPFIFPENACDMKVIPNQNGGETVVVLTENNLYTFRFAITN